MAESSPAGSGGAPADRRRRRRDAPDPRRGGRAHLPVRGAAGRRRGPGRAGAAAALPWKRRPTRCGGPCSLTSPIRTPAAATPSSPSGKAPGPSAASGQNWQRIGSDVRASHREYEFTEARNALLLRIGRPGPGVRAALGPVRLPARSPCATPWRTEVALAPGKLALLLGLPGRPGRARRSPAGPLTSAGGPGLADAPGLEFLRPRPVRIAGRETRHGGRRRLTGRVAAAGRSRGREQRRDRGPRGSTAEAGRAWVVIIPGTQLDGLPQGTNPFDAAGIAEGLGYDSAETAAAIRQALRQAGAEAGDQVAAVGYSQGGIHAMNLSQDKAVPGRVRPEVRADGGFPGGRHQPRSRGSAACIWSTSRTGCRGRTGWPTRTPRTG